jgi:Tfp pilus assembly protein PilV
MMTRHNTTPCRQHGATLVEVIVAILLLASCVIGIAAIYAQRQNIARGGREHEHAVELAQQIATSIRQASNGKDNFETALGATCDSKLSKLDPTANLVACWQDSVEKELTDGSARISLDRSTVPEQYVIVVSWSEPHNGTASYVLRVAAGSGDKAATAIAGSGATRAAG